MRIETRLPPHKSETSTASKMLRRERGSIGADAERNFYCYLALRLFHGSA
jgi:hypothetical protein